MIHPPREWEKGERENLKHEGEIVGNVKESRKMGKSVKNEEEKEC